MHACKQYSCATCLGLACSGRGGSRCDPTISDVAGVWPLMARSADAPPNRSGHGTSNVHHAPLAPDKVALLLVWCGTVGSCCRFKKPYFWKNS